jgi:Endoplasmic Reticulum-Golgi Intermediate Compartment (ERGIC)
MAETWDKLRKLDAFGKVNQDFALRTLSGGVITVLSSLIMAILFFSELRECHCIRHVLLQSYLHQACQHPPTRPMHATCRTILDCADGKPLVGGHFQRREASNQRELRDERTAPISACTVSVLHQTCRMIGFIFV